MKNLKMKKKFYAVSSILLLITMFMGVMGIGGMYLLNKQMKRTMNVNMPNTKCIDDIHLNAAGEEKWSLLAMQDKSSTAKWLELAHGCVEASRDDFEYLKANSKIDMALIGQLEGCFDELQTVREKFHAAVKSGNDTQAGRILKDQMLPLLMQENEILGQMAQAQEAINADMMHKAQSVYFIIKIVAILCAVISMLIGAAFARVLTRRIIIPLEEVREAAECLEKGDFSKEITYESTDELGETCEYLRKSFGKLREVIQITSQELEDLSEGNFSICVSEKKFPGETVYIQKSLKKLLAKLNDSLGNIKMSAAQIGDGAVQVANGAQALAQGATEQAGTVTNLSEHLSRVSEEIITNAEYAKDANGLANESGELAHDALSDMKQMTEVMNEISKTSQDIGKVIKVIDDIAFQTNILALNAAVEAARAGAAGKGFAVVADEVRNLAAKSAEAAQNTTGLIENAMRSVSNGVAKNEKTNAAFATLVEKVEATVNGIQQISEISARQAEHIQEITTAVDQISAVVQTNSATSEEDAAASEELSSQAAVLNQIIEQFTLYEASAGATSVSPKAAQEIVKNAKEAEGQPGAQDNAFSKY